MQREDFLAAIVTYFRDRDFSGRIDAILRPFEGVIIVDNASAGESRAMFEELCSSRDRFAISRNDRNTGVAHALNQGFRRALERGCRWAATFDQDTAVSGGYLESMLDEASAQEDVGVGVIGCNCDEPNLAVSRCRT